MHHPRSWNATAAKLNDVEPLAYLTGILQRIVSGRTKNYELRMLLTWNWRPDSVFTTDCVHLASFSRA